MTPSYRAFLAIDEVNTLRLSCQKCHASLHIPLEKREDIPHKCPVCEREWLIVPSPYRTSVMDFAKALVELRRTVIENKKQPQNSSCDIHLEITQPFTSDKK